MKPRIEEEAVHAVFLDCLFRPEETTGSQVPVQVGENAAYVPEGAVLVQGVAHDFGFHPGRLEQHRAEIAAWLRALPRQFQQDGGGGWSFLNACDDIDGNQWTDLHLRMEQLFCLGLGLRLVMCMAPRDLWGMMPGGMPYYMVFASASEAPHA